MTDGRFPGVRYIMRVYAMSENGAAATFDIKSPIPLPAPASPPDLLRLLGCHDQLGPFRPMTDAEITAYENGSHDDED